MIPLKKGPAQPGGDSLRLLDYVLAGKIARGRNGSPPLSVLPILGRAQLLYSPGSVSAPIVLAKTRESENADLPSAELVLDPLRG